MFRLALKLDIDNFVFQFVGIILIAIGVLVEIRRKEMQSINDQLALPVFLLILVGFIIVINSLFGMIGTFIENVTLLKVVSSTTSIFVFSYIARYLCHQATLGRAVNFGCVSVNIRLYNDNNNNNNNINNG